MYHFTDFIICPSKADYDLFFNGAISEAVNYAINYQMEQYEYEHDGYVPDPSQLVIHLYPDSEDFRIEIQSIDPALDILMVDSISAWQQALQQDYDLF